VSEISQGGKLLLPSTGHQLERTPLAGRYLIFFDHSGLCFYMLGLNVTLKQVKVDYGGFYCSQYFWQLGVPMSSVRSGC